MTREVVVLAFAGPDGAETALEALGPLRRENRLVLEDAAVVRRDMDGRVEIVQTREVSAGRGAGWGGALGLLAGAVVATPVGGALLGAGYGALAARLNDVGLDNRWMRNVAASVPPGGSALFLMIVHADRERALGELARMEGGATLLNTTLDEGVASEIREALRERRDPPLS